MRKLRLDLHRLSVESFDLPGAPPGGGTVRGRDSGGHRSGNPDCVPSYEMPCWWTGDPMANCNPPSTVHPCSDYPLEC